MSQDFPDLEGYQIDDSWAVAHSSIRNLPVIVRLRPNLIDIAGHPQLSHRIRVICLGFRRPKKCPPWMCVKTH